MVFDLHDSSFYELHYVIRTKMLLCNDFTITLKELQVREIALHEIVPNRTSTE